MKKTPKSTKELDSLKHKSAKRRNIPTIEYETKVMTAGIENTVDTVMYDRTGSNLVTEFRNREIDNDPQIIWRGSPLNLTKTQVDALIKGETVELSEAQLVWRNKESKKLEVSAPTLYIHEKVHPKAFLGNLISETKSRHNKKNEYHNLFSDFNGLDDNVKTDFYKHRQNWQNRLILGDSLQVMTSLSKREKFGGGGAMYIL